MRVEGSGGAEVFDNRHTQRAALFGVGGRAKLVEQHQRIGRDVERHFADMRDVGGKRAEIFLDGLIIADIRQHLRKDGEFGLGGGHRNGRLRHQGEQSDGLQTDRFAAGVGAADEQRAALLVEFEADGHHLFAPLAHNVFEQRMAGIAQQQAVAEAGMVQPNSVAKRAFPKISSSRAMVTSVCWMESP